MDDIEIEDIPMRLRAFQWIPLNTNWETEVQQIADVLLAVSTIPHKNLRITREMDIDPRLARVPLFGRENDIIRLLSLVEQGPTAILGIGGVGKSRLAFELLFTLEDIDGVAWHPVDEYSTSETLIDLLREHFELDANTTHRDILTCWTSTALRK